MKTDQTQKLVLEVTNLGKIFGDFVANDRVGFTLRKGEIHCLLGENGAGKSTFAKCLYGAYQPDSGKIMINGKEVVFNSPKDAIHHGVGMVHQHFVLVPTLSVAENIVVGTEKKGISPGLGDAVVRIEELCRKFDVQLDPNAIVSSLSVGEQQWVEILKTLYSGVELLILDEPTAALTPQESKQLFSIIKKMTEDGTSVIFITHKLNEVMAVSDRVTILRKGKKVGTLDTSATDKMELAVLMVGRGVHFEVDKSRYKPGESVLKVSDLSLNDDSGRAVLNNISLDVLSNEILGIAGVGGNGQMELFDTIVGVRPAKSGVVLLEGENITNSSPAQIAKKGVASIPADRLVQGLLLNFSVAENLILGTQREKKFKKNTLMSDQLVRKNAEELITEYDVATTGPGQVAGQLSGGNLQKLILARELSHEVKLMIANCPTRGLDVGAIEYVHQRLIGLRDQGKGVLLISEDLDEIFNLADRIAVIYQGEIMGIFDNGMITREEVGLLMAGVRDGLQ